MVPKIKERWINAGFAILSGACVAFLVFFMNSSEGRSIRLKNELNSKANTEWVKEQDSVIQANIEREQETWRDGHILLHNSELETLNSKIEGVDGKLQLIIDFWDIEDEGRGD